MQIENEMEQARAACMMFQNAIKQNMNIVSDVSIRDVTLVYFPSPLETSSLTPKEQNEYAELYNEFIKYTKPYHLNVEGFNKLKIMVLEAFEKIAPYCVITGKMTKSQWEKRQATKKVVDAVEDASAKVSARAEHPPENIHEVRNAESEKSAQHPHIEETKNNQEKKQQKKGRRTIKIIFGYILGCLAYVAGFLLGNLAWALTVRWFGFSAQSFWGILYSYLLAAWGAQAAGYVTFQRFAKDSKANLIAFVIIMISVSTVWLTLCFLYTQWDSILYSVFSFLIDAGFIKIILNGKYELD